MPRRPSAAARRGTAFHAWVESQYGQQSLWQPADLPGAADEHITTDRELEELTAAFARSPYASRTPLAVEAPFALLWRGRVLHGRIDAVFAADPSEAPGCEVEVVDWKSGGRGSLSDLQLAIDRLAWAELSGTPLDRIEAAFVLVRTGEVLRPERLPDREDIERLLSGH